MAISLIDNLKIQNKKQNVERDSFATIAVDGVNYYVYSLIEPISLDNFKQIFS